jgi:FMN phosphatase YigB (HAD superfamily)
MTHKRILYLDMDGVLVDFWSGVHRMPASAHLLSG